LETTTIKHHWQAVESGNFIEGYTYTSERDGDFTIALSITGINFMGLIKMENLLEAEIAETEKIIADGSTSEYYTKHLDELTKCLEALKRARQA